jgi:cobalt-zinc-cadmium efflux system membrane fusion protein
VEKLVHSPTAGLGLFGWLVRSISPLIVLTALAGVFIWGHLNNWTIPKFSKLVDIDDDEKEKEDEQSRPFWVENGEDSDLNNRRIHFASEEAVERVGIKSKPVERKAMKETTKANGEVTFDQTRMARLSARVPGAVFRAIKQVGDPVEKGEVLCLVDAAEVGKAKAEFLKALVATRLRSETYARLKEAYPRGGVSDQALRESASALSEARIRLTTAQQAMTNLGLPIEADSLQAVPQDKLGDRLRFLGLPEKLAGTLDPKTATGNLLPVVAPFEGVVVTRNVVAGEVVDNAKVLFMIVDPRQMWLTLNVRLEDSEPLALGMQVLFSPDGAKNKKDNRAGRITWISPEVDRKTRTVMARAVLANADGRLKANTFGAGEIIFRNNPNVMVVPNQAVHLIVVPNQAVQRADKSYIVFIRDKKMETVFHARKVSLGTKDNNHTEIKTGLLHGEYVATEGSGLLRDELLRDRLGGKDEDDK